jgi:hypothetical protein
VLPRALGHVDGVLLTMAFLGSGAAYAWLAMRAWEGRSWRMLSALLLLATLVAYVSVAATGGEGDQVGIATALMELAALGHAWCHRASPAAPVRRFIGAAGTVFATTVGVWSGQVVHRHAASGRPPPGPRGGAIGHSGDHGNSHDASGAGQRDHAAVTAERDS